MVFKGVCATALFFFMLCYGDTCNGDEYCKDFKPQNHDEVTDTAGYLLHFALKDGIIQNSKNLYNIQKANFKQKSALKIACLSVRFKLQCISQDGNCSLQVKAKETDLECSVDANDTRTVFLWSSFDTSSTFGSLLLTYTVYDLRVFGFGWEDNCDQYQVPINIMISRDEIPCVTKYELCSALQYMTTLLPAYSIARNISTETEGVGIGYASPWHENLKDQIWKIHGMVAVITISILVLSKLIFINLALTYYNSIVDLMEGKNSGFYYLYWGCHCTTFWVFLIAYITYIAKTQDNKAIFIVSYALGLLFDLLIAAVTLVIVIKSKKGLLPVPLTAYTERCCCKLYSVWKCVLNFLAFFFTSFFIGCLLQIVPNILVSYYAFPSRTLIHLGYFQVSLVCLVTAFGGLIFLLEKCGWFIHINKHKKIPKELSSTDLIINYINIQKPKTSTCNTANGSSSRYGTTQSNTPTYSVTSNPSGEASNTAGVAKADQPQLETYDSANPNLNSTGGSSNVGSAPNQQPDQAQQSSTLTEPNWDMIEFYDVKLKNPKYLFCIMFLQIFTALLLMIAISLLIVVIGFIVLTDTLDKNNLQGILTLLPAIIIDAVFILTRKRFFDKQQESKNQLAGVVEENAAKYNPEKAVEDNSEKAAKVVNTEKAVKKRRVEDNTEEANEKTNLLQQYKSP